MGRQQADGPFEMRVSGRTEYLTPRWVLAQLGKFDLDPCAAVGQYRTARRMLTTGGLEASWKGLVYLNPPYGSTNQERRWLEKLAAHDAGGIAFVLAKTGTKLWHEVVSPKMAGVLFLNGRVMFNGPDQSCTGGYPGIDQALVAFGDTALKRLQLTTLDGRLVTGSRAVGGQVTIRGRKD